MHSDAKVEETENAMPGDAKLEEMENAIYGHPKPETGEKAVIWKAEEVQRTKPYARCIR